MAPRKKFYVVWNGYATGVFDSWEECQLQVKGYPDAKYKSFDSQEAAVAAYRGDPAEQLDLLKAIAQGPKVKVNYEAIPGIQLDALAVDAACSKNPGPVEYQGVWVRTGERIFHAGPFEGGRTTSVSILHWSTGLPSCISRVNRMSLSILIQRPRGRGCATASRRLR